MPDPASIPELPAGVKYQVRVARRGPQSFRLHLGTSHVDVEARHLNDGGLLIQVCPALMFTVDRIYPLIPCMYIHLLAW